MKIFHFLIIISSLAILSSVLLIHCAWAQQPSQPAKGTKRAVAYDPKSSMPVVCIDIPASWNFNSSVRWDYENCVVGIELKGYSPDGREVFHVYPQAYIHAPAGAPVLTGERFLSELILPQYKKIDPGATFAFKEVRTSPQSTPQNHIETVGFGVSFSKDGTKWIEVGFTEVISASGAYSMLYSFTINSYVSPSDDPNGSAEKFSKIFLSMKYNDVFIKYQSEVNGLILSQRRAEASANIARMNNETAEYIRKSRLDTYNNNLASRDRVNRYIEENIKQINTVSDPYTGTRVGVSNEYNHTWFNSNGDYIQSESSLYNPNQDKTMNNVEWRKVK